MLLDKASAEEGVAWADVAGEVAQCYRDAGLGATADFVNAAQS